MKYFGPVKAIVKAVPLALALSVLVAGCSGAASSLSLPASASLISDPSIAAFQTSVYPIVRKHCIACHGSDISPLFAHDDPALAHGTLVVTQKVNFTDPQASALVLRLRTLGHNCWGVCEDNAAQMQDAITTWAKASTYRNPDAPNYFTEEVLVPAGIPFADPNNITNNVYSLMRFPISTWLPGGSNFNWEIMLGIKDLDQASYYVSDLRAVAVGSPVNTSATVPSQKIFAKSFSILVNGVNYFFHSTYYGVAATFNTILSTIPEMGGQQFQNIRMSPTANSVPPAGQQTPYNAMILAKDLGAGLDRLSIGVVNIGYGDLPEGGLGGGGGGTLTAGQRYNLFRNLVTQKCAGCHQGTASPARPVWNVLASFAATEAQWKNYRWDPVSRTETSIPVVIPGDANNSYLYRMVVWDTQLGTVVPPPLPPGHTAEPAGDFGRMPKGGPYLNNNEIAIIRDWINGLTP